MPSQRPLFLAEHDHLAEFKQLVKQCGEDQLVQIITPWLRHAPLKAIVQALPDHADLTVIVRWPQPGEPPGLLEVKALLALQALQDEEKATVEWLRHPQRLHAKVYYVEGQGAIVSSANLTGAGFAIPEEQTHRNVELGVLLKDVDSLQQVRQWIEKLDTASLEPKHCQQLQDWGADYREQAKGRDRLPDPPKPEPAPSPAAEALAFAREKDLITHHEHLSQGWGKQAFTLRLPGDRRTYRLRALTSVRAAPQKKDPSLKYHFNIPKHDVEAWKKAKKGSHLHGVLLVPVAQVNGRRSFDTGGPGPVFLPFNYLFRRGHLAPAQFMKALSSEATPTLYLTQGQDDEWYLRCTMRKDRLISLEGCLRATKQLTQTR